MQQVRKKIKILIVDDEESARFLMSDILGDDYDVKEAHNVSTALKIFEDFNPQIIISDIKMPGEDGISLLGKIKVISPGTYVILVTGHGDKRIAIDALKGGAFDFLEKPYESAELLKIID